MEICNKNLVCSGCWGLSICNNRQFARVATWEEKKNGNCRDSCWSSSASRTKSKHNRRAFGGLYGEEVQENTHRWQHTKGNESAQSRRCEKEWDKKLAICEAGSTFHYPHSHRLSRHLGVPVHCPLHECLKLSRVAYTLTVWSHVMLP